MFKLDASHDTSTTIRQRVLLLALSTLTYVAITQITTWLFIGDAPDYAQSAVSQFFNGDCVFLEFGHLLWRPTAYGLLAGMTGGHGITESKETWIQALSLLNGAAWVAGLVTVLAVTTWLLKVTASVSATLIGVAFVIVNKSFLNFAQVGTSYVPALAFLSLALLLGENDRVTRTARLFFGFAAGVCLAGSMLYWATYVFAAPAVLLAPLILSDQWRRRVPQVMVTALTCATLMLATYAWVGNLLDLHSLSDYRVWVSASQHGISIGGPARAAIGLARFVVDLGAYGSDVKRFMLHDPYASVRLWQLFGVDLLKLVGVYAVAVVALFYSWRASNGRRIVLFFALAFAPMLIFGVLWQGGDLERYLPALPAMALIVAAGFAGAGKERLGRNVIAGGVLCIAAVNISAMLSRTVRRDREEHLARFSGVPAASLRRDLFILSHWHDPLMAAVRERPFDALVQSGLSVYPLVTFGTPQVPTWREQFARRVLSAWREKRRTWVSSRLLAERPNRAWNWLEGDDARVTWADIYRQFQQLDYETSIGTSQADFQLLPDTPSNRAVMEALTATDGLAPTSAERRECRPIKVFRTSQ